MARCSSFLLFFTLAVVGQALTPTTFFTTNDQARLRAHFLAASPYKDLPTAHYSILGLTLLGAAVPNNQEACKYAQSKYDPLKVDSVYFASSISKALKGCMLPPDAGQTLADAVNENSSVQDLFYVVSAMKNLNQVIDSPKVSKVLSALLKKDDSIASLGYSFHIAAMLSGNVDTFFDRIEDAIVQADEVDGKYLQFEQGAGTTALVAIGAYQLAETLNKPPPISANQAMKFANYFVHRKHTANYRSAYLVLRALKTFTNNKFHIPIAVTMAGQTAVSLESPTVTVQVSNLLGESLGKLNVVAEKATRLDDSAVVLSKRPLKPVPGGDQTLYEFNLMTEAKPSRGFYEIAIDVTSGDVNEKRLLSTSDALVSVKVTTAVMVADAEVSLVDRDQSTAPKGNKVNYPSKVATVMEADYHQKLLMKFMLKDKLTQEVMKVHQAFVMFTNKNTKQEIIYVAEPDTKDVYKFDLDVAGKAAEFSGVSGQYLMSLIIGDAVITNPFTWNIAEVKLKFPEGLGKDNDDGTASPYAVKPEIKHQFREPEKRPPSIISNAFTALVLVPVLVLLIMWFKIGVNMGNFPFSPSALGFHLGLTCIFGLYYYFWIQLNMFDTMKYLTIVGGITFFFGNRLLGSIASKR
ncbi:PREDICTED: dolichyl-diphosphooligosaccharide--protein glycosyltransferase subunit 2-like [Priapulus caudatus]|uniref:Dolichyl-diphosphooligosaccharide--protein glycosyltransferase subunit 2 n=1 Tax=Priapulus caudatus TaxID=37621 RepID=A0ABM1EV64_PRICU|nr:PREDICTED: dolichyl-diphosphooligosaccharide--protein glycosyltransferase subunit 2-like [Priapulus caudatus]